MSDQPCKKCGHCPACGRSGYGTYPAYPHWQWIPPQYPYYGTGDHWTYPGTTRITCSSASANTNPTLGSFTITS